MNESFTPEEILLWLARSATFDIRNYLYRDEQGRQQVNFDQLNTFKPTRVESMTIREDGHIIAFAFYNGQAIEHNGIEWVFKSDGVYLIRAEGGLTKIGHSGDVEARLATLQVTSPVRLILLHYWPSMKAPEVERELHKRYTAKRKHGEWFDLSDGDIAAIAASFDEQSTDQI